MNSVYPYVVLVATIIVMAVIYLFMLRRLRFSWAAWLVCCVAVTAVYLTMPLWVFDQADYRAVFLYIAFVSAVVGMAAFAVQMLSGAVSGMRGLKRQERPSRMLTRSFGGRPRVFTRPLQDRPGTRVYTLEEGLKKYGVVSDNAPPDTPRTDDVPPIDDAAAYVDEPLGYESETAYGDAYEGGEYVDMDTAVFGDDDGEYADEVSEDADEATVYADEATEDADEATEYTSEASASDYYGETNAYMVEAEEYEIEDTINDYEAAVNGDLAEEEADDTAANGDAAVCEVASADDVDDAAERADEHAAYNDGTIALTDETAAVEEEPASSADDTAACADSPGDAAEPPPIADENAFVEPPADDAAHPDIPEGDAPDALVNPITEPSAAVARPTPAVDAAPFTLYAAQLELCFDLKAQGRWDDAVEAFFAAMRACGETAELKALHIEALGALIKAERYTQAAECVFDILSAYDGLSEGDRDRLREVLEELDGMEIE